MNNEQKKVFTELLGYELWNGGSCYKDEKEEIETISSFNPESDEYYWKILEALNSYQNNETSEYIVKTAESKLLYFGNNLDSALWYNTHREEVLKAIAEVTSE